MRKVASRTQKKRGNRRKYCRSKDKGGKSRNQMKRTGKSSTHDSSRNRKKQDSEQEKEQEKAGL